MSAFVRDVLAAYLTAAALVAVGFGLLRAVLALGMERRLDARQTLRVGRVTLGLAVLLPFVGLAAREWLPSAPLFTFERSLVRHVAPLTPAEARPVRGAVQEAASSGPGLPWASLGLGFLGVGTLAFLAWELRRYARLRRKLEALPVLRRVGRVRVVLGDAAEGAFSVWFPGDGAWAVVPSGVLEDAEALRLTVRHELQHHRQRDTVLAYARLGFDSAFFWNPFARAFSRWLAERQEFACDEALVAVKRVSRRRMRGACSRRRCGSRLPSLFPPVSPACPTPPSGGSACCSSPVPAAPFAPWVCRCRWRWCSRRWRCGHKARCGGARCRSRRRVRWPMRVARRGTCPWWWMPRWWSSSTGSSPRRRGATSCARRWRTSRRTVRR
ncbi:hypothetical protein KH5H1_50300 [Corallococcus caeni]|nr:hypothetical protein KH5H1_50300 [Corallococcus sp. KH5-1]